MPRARQDPDLRLPSGLDSPAALLTPKMVKRLSLMDARSYEAGMLGCVPEGLYRP